MAFRDMDRWFGSYMKEVFKRRPPRRGEDVHLLLCVADHYEPKQNRPASEVSRGRVQRWVHDYPRQFGRFRDADGRTPRHSFFYPLEEYEAEYLDALAGLCRDGFGEIEVHLHHDNDTADNLRAIVAGFTELLAHRHGLLSRRRDKGELAYGFIHGNWALCNSRPDGRWCGVNNELESCARPAATPTSRCRPPPHPHRQIRSTASTMPATSPAGRARTTTASTSGRGRDRTTPDADPGAVAAELAPPQIRPAAAPGKRLSPGQPAGHGRARRFVAARRVQVPTRPDWFFVKLHAHGAAEESHEVLLGQPMVDFHEALARRARDNPMLSLPLRHGA